VRTAREGAGARRAAREGPRGATVRRATHRAGRRNARLLGGGEEEMIWFRVWMVVVSYIHFILGQAVGLNHGMEV